MLQICSMINAMSWLFLILTLPTENTSARMRAWRGVKAAGASVLRDGVYLLPANDARQAALAAIAEDVLESGGEAWLLPMDAADYAFESLFDRTEAFGKIAAEAERLGAHLDASPLSGQDKQVRKLRRAFDTVMAIDFFPGEAARQTDALLARLEHQIKVAAGRDEPSPQLGQIAHLNLADYQGRVWATRARPWVDRLASAWLIRRHIDPAARFLWLAQPSDCPADALGFDFDGATFSHVGERVTFETLLASFNLETDPALVHMARVVHFLDVGGLPAPEAAGLEAILGGMRATLNDDNELLAAASQTFDYMVATERSPHP